MKVLITGGAGFIGSNLADNLIARGDQVIIVDDLTTGLRNNVNPQAEFYDASITDAEELRSIFNKSKPDMVVHAAASYKDPNNWTRDAQVNAIGTRYVVECCKEVGVKRIVYFQTSLCYGHHPDEQPITLSHRINPDNSYAISKTAGEQTIIHSGLDFVSFRLANCYGPRNLSGPVPTFYHKIVNDQKCFISDARRDFIYIDDLLKIVLMALDGKGEKGIYHVATGTDYPIEEIYKLVVKELGKGSSGGDEEKYFGRFWDDVKTILLDPSKTKDAFGYIPKTTMEEGIPKAIEWYKKNGVTQTYTHLTSEDLKVREIKK